MTATIASGWSDSCRVEFAPTGYNAPFHGALDSSEAIIDNFIASFNEPPNDNSAPHGLKARVSNISAGGNLRGHSGRRGEKLQFFLSRAAGKSDYSGSVRPSYLHFHLSAGIFQTGGDRGEAFGRAAGLNFQIRNLPAGLRRQTGHVVFENP
jgi:hypothetical protein